MKKVPTATCALRDKYIVSIERVYTPSTFYIQSAVLKILLHRVILLGTPFDSHSAVFLHGESKWINK